MVRGDEVKFGITRAGTTFYSGKFGYCGRALTLAGKNWGSLSALVRTLMTNMVLVGSCSTSDNDTLATIP